MCPNILIVGGGAAGLDLATQLGNKLGKKKLAKIILIDDNLSNLWKPLWHEVAAGTITSSDDEIQYLAQAKKHSFMFHLGRLIGLDRTNRFVNISEVRDDSGMIVLPSRILKFDFLIIAIGSIHNDFNVVGVNENCYSFDSYKECQSFHQVLLNKFVRIQENLDNEINITIIGGGATGVELAAELYYACKQNLVYTYDACEKKLKFCIQLIESSSRILSSMPDKISNIARKELENLDIKVYTNEKVIKVDKDMVYAQSGLSLKSTLKLWAAGIKVSDITTKFDLEVDSLNRILVRDTLQTTYDDNIFAIGDCARYQIGGSEHLAPATAQVARQQAILLVKSLVNHITYAKDLSTYKYNDYGSLVSLSQKDTVGYFKGFKTINSITLRGKIAIFMYRFLFRRYQASLHGWWSTLLLIISQFLTKSIRPKVKLH